MEARMKTCSSCEVTKPLTEFFKEKSNKNGLRNQCKVCRSLYSKNLREKKNSTIEGRALEFLRHAKESSVRRNQVFELEVADVVDCWDKQLQICAYSGRKMTLENAKPNTVSIERIDSDIGYTKNNTILVCNTVNRMKSNFELPEFVSFCRDISKFLNGVV
jgi:hypothetical protein